MKKLNITKEQFNRSHYFKNKYGKLEYVSESGKVFKTNKGKILMFKEYHDSGDPPRKDKNDGACDNLAPGEYGLSREFADGIGTRYVIYQGGRRPGEMYKVKVFGARERRRAEEVLAGLQDGSIDEKNLKYVSENGKLLKFKESKQMNEGVFGDIGDSIDDGIRGIKKFFHKAKFKKGDKIMVCMADFTPPGVQHGLEVIDTKYGGWSGDWEYRTGTDDWGNPEWWPELSVALDTNPDGGYEKYDPEKFPEFKKMEKYIKKPSNESTKFGRKFAKEAYARGVSKRSLKELKSALKTIEVVLSDNDQELTTVLPREFERMLRVAEMKVQRALDMQSKMKGSELE